MMSNNIDMATRILGCTSDNSHPFPSNWKINQWRILCEFIALVHRRFEKKTIAFGQKETTLSPRQCKGAHLFLEITPNLIISKGAKIKESLDVMTHKRDYVEKKRVFWHSKCHPRKNYFANSRIDNYKAFSNLFLLRFPTSFLSIGVFLKFFNFHERQSSFSNIIIFNDWQKYCDSDFYDVCILRKPHSTTSVVKYRNTKFVNYLTLKAHKSNRNIFLINTIKITINKITTKVRISIMISCLN